MGVVEKAVTNFGHVSLGSQLHFYYSHFDVLEVSPLVTRCNFGVVSSTDFQIKYRLMIVNPKRNHTS